MTDTPAVVAVILDLRAIEALYGGLLTQAVHKANHRDMPGGPAMVALGPAADPDEWAERLAADEFMHFATCTRTSHDRCTYDWRAADDDGEPPLQTLLFWSEQWREQRGHPLDGRKPTVATEAGFLRWVTQWAWETEPHFADYAADVKRARTRLENVLYAGVRKELGVPCLYDECKGARIFRHVEDDGTRSDWRCGKCGRTWPEDRYAAMVTAAHLAAQIEQVGEVTWVSADLASKETGRSIKTIRDWAYDGIVAAVCFIAGRRTGYVDLAEVREKDRDAGRRSRGDGMVA